MDNLGQIWVIIIIIMIINTVSLYYMPDCIPITSFDPEQKLHFANEKTEAQRGLIKAKITQLISSRIWNIFSS